MVKAQEIKDPRIPLQRPSGDLNLKRERATVDPLELWDCTLIYTLTATLTLDPRSRTLRSSGYSRVMILSDRRTVS